MSVACKSGNRVLFFCPGCECAHGPVVEGGGWTWNGSLDSPTFSPSILVRFTRQLTDTEIDRVMNGEQLKNLDVICHSYVRNGRIQFLGDCTHALVGQTVDIPEWETT